MRRRKILSAFLWLLPVWAVLVPTGAAFAASERPVASPLQVVTRAGAHQEYGRIVFDWPQPVGHKAHISGNRLRVEFARPMVTALGSIRRNLSAYIARIALVSDGKVVTATLKGDYALRSFAKGNRVVVDLMQRPGDGASAADREAKAAKSAPAPAGGNVAAKTTAVQPTPLRRRGATNAPRGARGGPRPARLTVRGGSHAGFGRLVFEWPVRVDYRIGRKGRTVSVRFDRAAEVNVESVRRTLPRQIGSVTSTATAKGLRMGFVVAKGARLRHFRDGNNVVLDVISAPTTAARSTRDRPTVKRKAPSARPVAAGRAAKPVRRPVPLSRRAPAETGGGEKAKAKQSITGAPVTVDATRQGTETTLRFNWRKTVAAAVYRRANVLWIVFDRSRLIDLAKIRVTGREMFETVEQLVVPDAAVLRIAMAWPYHVSVKRDGAIWIVSVSPKKRPPGRSVPVNTKYGGAAGTRVVLTADGASRAIRLHDPEVGDLAYVVPLATLGLGLPVTRRFLDFELLESAQGLSIRPISEALSIHAGDGRVIISRTGGLRISRPVDLAKREAVKGRQLLDFAAWRLGPRAAYQEIEHKLIARVTTSRGLQRNAARLSLARLYAAYGMGAEALGVLQALVRESPAVMRDHKVRALRGVAAYQLGHYVDAAADLGHPSLIQKPGIQPWLAGIAVARGDWSGAYRLFEETDPIIASYPPDIATSFAIMAVEAALSVEDVETAKIRLERLKTVAVNGSQRAQITYLSGHLAKKMGDVEDALLLWEAVAASDDRPSRAKATYARINALLEQEEIDRSEAIERLEGLRFAWRNDVFEFDLLHRLGRLHAEKLDYRNALLTLRQAATYYSNIKGAEALTGEMSELFKSFYNGGEAEKSAPITALGLYREFRELTPPGTEGDELIHKLARRLVKVDLLSHAAELLDHQITHRLEGLSKGEIGTRLAEIRLMDRKPKNALEALADSAVPDLPAVLTRRRDRVKAVALSGLDKHDEALEVIAAYHDDEADRLRADILWNAKRWRRAAQILARLTGGVNREKIGKDASNLLLRRAVALALNKDRKGLKFLRDRFGKGMEKSFHGNAFLAVVGTGTIDTDDYRIMARSASELDVFLAFRRNERKQTAKPPPAVN